MLTSNENISVALLNALEKKILEDRYAELTQIKTAMGQIEKEIGNRLYGNYVKTIWPFELLLFYCLDEMSEKKLDGALRGLNRRERGEFNKWFTSIRSILSETAYSKKHKTNKTLQGLLLSDYYNAYSKVGQLWKL